MGCRYSPGGSVWCKYAGVRGGMSIKQVSVFLENLCKTTFEGGRLVVGDSNTVLLYDVPSWPGSRTDALRERFPHCNIDVHQADTSASGFVVVVNSQQQVNHYRAIIVVVVSLGVALLTGLAALNVFLSEHPNWDHVDLYTCS
jgi:hypothetical protein